MTWENENTYNPSCNDFDVDLGCCGYHGNDWKCCRKESFLQRTGRKFEKGE